MTSLKLTTNNSNNIVPQRARSYRKDGYWFFQFAEGVIFGPFDKVYDAVMKDREFEERELDKNETTRLLLQFA